MVSAYRSDEAVLKELVNQMVTEHGCEVARLDLTVRPVVLRRAGRIVAGAVGTLAGLLFWLLSLRYALTQTPAWYTVGAQTDGLLVGLLLGAWALMGIAYLLSGLVGDPLLDRALTPSPQLSGRPRADLERLRTAEPHRHVIELLDRMGAPSFGLPLAAIGLLAPITLHLAVWIAWCCGHGPEQWQDFDGWIKLSAAYVGIAHLVLAGCCLRLGHRIGRERNVSPGTIATTEGFKAYVVTVLAAFVPGIVFLFSGWTLLPPVITAITGAVFMPLSCRLVAKQATAERKVVAKVEA
jgi:hypothetical protein